MVTSQKTFKFKKNSLKMRTVTYTNLSPEAILKEVLHAAESMRMKRDLIINIRYTVDIAIIARSLEVLQNLLQKVRDIFEESS